MITKKRRPGRPRTVPNIQTIGISMPSALVKRVDAYAKRINNNSRSAVIRVLLTLGLDQVEKKKTLCPTCHGTGSAPKAVSK